METLECLRQSFVAGAVVAVLTVTGAAVADDKGHHGFNFKPLDESANAADWDPAAPWKLPKGFTQAVVSDETNLNIYDGGRDDWHDMNVVNETGKMAGRFMYRTHELRYPANQPEGGTVTVVDLETGETRILAQDPGYDALDGIRWTPWGTVLFAEEKTGGRLLEIELNDDMMSAAAVIDRPAVGRLAHEGIDLDATGMFTSLTNTGAAVPVVMVSFPVAVVSTSSCLTPTVICLPVPSTCWVSKKIRVATTPARAYG